MWKICLICHEGLRGYFYVISRAVYEKNSQKIPADTFDLENLYFKVKFHF